MEHPAAGTARRERDRELAGEREAERVRDEDARHAQLARPLEEDQRLGIRAVVREHDDDLTAAQLEERVRECLTARRDRVRGSPDPPQPGREVFGQRGIRAQALDHHALGRGEQVERAVEVGRPQRRLGVVQ